MKMLKFTLAEDGIPFNFFDEVDFSFQKVIVACLREKFPSLTMEGAEAFFWKRYDDFAEPLNEMRQYDAIGDCFICETEVDEATGTWGYYEYEVTDVNKVRIELEKEVREITKGVLSEIEDVE